ncbi:MAG: hypothetical protein ACOC2W_03735 [bacterium]
MNRKITYMIIVTIPNYLVIDEILIVVINLVKNGTEKIMLKRGDLYLIDSTWEFKDLFIQSELICKEFVNHSLYEFLKKQVIA